MRYSYDRRTAGELIPMRRAPKGPQVRIKGRAYATYNGRLIAFLPEKSQLTVWEPDTGEQMASKRIRQLKPEQAQFVNIVSLREYKAIDDDMGHTRHLLEQQDSVVELDPWKDR